MAGKIGDTAKLVASLTLKTDGFVKGVNTAVGSMGKLSKSVAASRAVAVGVGVGRGELDSGGPLMLA